MPWYICKVTRAGPADNGKVYIGLRDLEGAFDNIWFEAEESQEREMLATALAAITSGLSVQVRLEAEAEYSHVERLYLRAGV